MLGSLSRNAVSVLDDVLLHVRSDYSIETTNRESWDSSTVRKLFLFKFAMKWRYIIWSQKTNSHENNQFHGWKAFHQRNKIFTVTTRVLNRSTGPGRKVEGWKPNIQTWNDCPAFEQVGVYNAMEIAVIRRYPFLERRPSLRNHFEVTVSCKTQELKDVA